MLKIRLTRRGKRNKAFFRLVVAEHTSPIKGRFLEALGFLNPHTKEKSIKTDRVKYWLEKGAQCSDTVHNLLVREGIVKGPKRAVKMKTKIADNAKAADSAGKANEKEEAPAPKKEDKDEKNEKESETEAEEETKENSKTEKEKAASPLTKE